jgi:capsular exopolysaccharide synthesis family protein
MSKVYEALRVKEQENLGVLRPANAEDETVAECDSLHDCAAFTIGDETLEDVLAAADDDAKMSVEPDQRPHAQSGSRNTEAQVPLNGYRRIKFASNENSRLIFHTDPHGLAAEQFRFLRRTLEQRFPKGAVLLITSPAPKDGKTLTSVNLSTCLADGAHSTLLVEADIRQPTVRKLLGGANETPGVEDVFAGTTEPEHAICVFEELSLHVAMVATPPPDPSRLVGADGAKHFLQWARKRFHWIVIDSPPALPAADVAQLGSLADAVLLVVRAQSTPRDLVIRTLELLADRVYGVILNEATIETNPYYRYLADYHKKA